MAELVCGVVGGFDERAIEVWEFFEDREDERFEMSICDGDEERGVELILQE